MEQKWMPIKGYEGLYEVSNLGEIRSIGRLFKNGIYVKFERPRIRKTYSCKDGYRAVFLIKHNKIKSFTVHRLVAHAFIPNPFELPQVNHKDENKCNNNANNLEWCNNLYNARYGTRNIRQSMKTRNNKRQSKPILQFSLDGIFISEYPSAKEAQRQTGIYNISSACNHKFRHKTAGGYVWKWKYKI